MQPEERDAAYLWDMLDAAMAVRDFVSARTYYDYQNDRMLRGAVERHIEIIGEAANHVSVDFKKVHPEIPWRSIIGQRPPALCATSRKFSRLRASGGQGNVKGEE